MSDITSVLLSRVQSAANVTPQAAFEQIKHLQATPTEANNDSVLHLESIVIKDWNTAVEYAKTAKGKWPAFEAMVETAEPAKDEQNGYAVLKYARDVIGDRWPRAEKHIETDGVLSAQYACKVIRGSWEKGSVAIQSINNDRDGFELYHSFLDSTGPKTICR